MAMDGIDAEAFVVAEHRSFEWKRIHSNSVRKKSNCLERCPFDGTAGRPKLSYGNMEASHQNIRLRA